MHKATGQVQYMNAVTTEVQDLSGVGQAIETTTACSAAKPKSETFTLKPCTNKNPSL